MLIVQLNTGMLLSSVLKIRELFLLEPAQFLSALPYFKIGGEEQNIRQYEIRFNSSLYGVSV